MAYYDRILITVERDSAAAFEEEANRLIEAGYRTGAQDIHLGLPRWAAMFELPAKRRDERRFVASMSNHLQQMFKILKAWKQEKMLDEDCIYALQARIESAFKALCKPTKDDYPKDLDREKSDSLPGRELKEK